MRRSIISCILFFLFAICANGQEQNTISAKNDTSLIENNNEPVSVNKLGKDSTNWDIVDEKVVLTKEQIPTKPIFKPIPKKAVIYSAIFPGLGQIYNRKYWKLPIIYGGLVGLTYGISWNGQYYNDYKDAYRGIAVEDPRNSFDKWKDMANLPSDTDIDDISDDLIRRYKDQFKRKKNFYRRNRDLCIIGVVAVYAVSMIDAYVDAQLFDFDISPDLSMKVEPIMMQSTVNSTKSFGLQCNFKF